MGDYEDRGIAGVDDLQVSCKFVLENSDLSNTSIIYMAVWEYPFRHALATFLA